MTTLARLTLAAALLVPAAQIHAHSEHERPRYVAGSGTDAGNCAEMFRPCRTIGYAVMQAGKGDRILVAAGEYNIVAAEELFYLISDALSIRGGYSRYEHFQISAPRVTVRSLNGLPAILGEHPDPPRGIAPRFVTLGTTDAAGRITRIYTLVAPDKIDALWRTDEGAPANPAASR